MPINPNAAGTTSEPRERSWDHKDCLLYALGVGAGMDDPTGAELEFTTENSKGITQRALPTMAVVLQAGGLDLAALGSFDLTKMLHGDQALLYRLNGDRNPLHSDPDFAGRGGFPKPILHGLCTYGFTGRALLHGLCGSDPSRFTSMEGRFSRPVYPGDTLTVSMWVNGNEGGLVPGVTVYAYMTRPVVERWGRDWVERGTMTARFVQPLYDGDQAT